MRMRCDVVNLELLLEDESMKNAVRLLLPKILGQLRSGARYHVAYRTFRGKYTLLKRLKTLLKGYAARIRDGETLRVIVLLDRDTDNCTELKQKLEGIASAAGLVVRSKATEAQPFQVLNRIAISELEAWFLGDLEAISQAYPKTRAVLAQQSRRFHKPDDVDDAWEALEKILKQSSYRGYDLSKPYVAERIAKHMQPERNLSESFQVFCEGLKVCLT
jgi:hypothetical protein